MKKIIGITALAAILALTACNGETSQAMADSMVSAETAVSEETT